MTLLGSAAKRDAEVAAAAAASAVAAYVVAVVLGGLLDSSYSHVAEAVSELTASHAPDRVLLGVLFCAYNVALLVLAVTLARLSQPHRGVTTGCCFLGLAACAGVAMVTIFPQDSTGSPATTAGATHIVVAAGTSLLFVAAAFLLAWGWREDPHWRALVGASRWVGVLLLLFGPLVAAAAASSSPYFGLAERAVLAVVLAWISMIGWHALRLARGPALQPAATRHP